MDQLVTETNPATVFHLVLVLLYLKKNNVVIHAPGRSLAPILAKLKGDIPPTTFSLLNDFQTKVIKYLTDKTSELENELVARLPELKAIVLNPSTSSEGNTTEKEKDQDNNNNNSNKNTSKNNKNKNNNNRKKSTEEKDVADTEQ